MSRPTKHKNLGALLLNSIRSGAPLKQIAGDIGHSRSWIYRKAQDLGFSAIMIDREEQNLISEHRRNKIKST